MFSFSAYGKRVGRIAFGAVLLAGMAILVQRLAILEEPGAEHVLWTTWATAVAAYVIAGGIGSRRVVDHPGELAIPGLVLPSVGVALILPLTLHLLVAYLLSCDARAFDSWVRISAVVTGPTHLALGALVGWRARQLAIGVPAISPSKIFMICVGTSCLPFAVLVIPPFLVALTGMPMAALMIWMEPLAARDRLHGAAEALPRAIAVRRLQHGA